VVLVGSSEWRTGLRRRVVAQARRAMRVVPPDLLWMASYDSDRALRDEVRAHALAQPLVTWSDDYVTYNVARRGAYEPSQLLFVRDHVRPATGDGLALDVGANLGVFTMVLAGAFQSVLAFEPAPDLVPLLELSLRFHGVQNVALLPVALSDSPGSARLERPAGHADNRGMGRLAPGEAVPGDGFSIELRSGDAEVADRQRPVRFIKIDVEGAEAAVLRGLSQTVATDRPVIAVEVLTTDALTLVESLVPRDYQAWALGLGRPRRFDRVGLRERSLVEHLDLVYLVPHELSGRLTGATVPAFR
jgi:FkbM family methyltransferase